MDSRSNQLLLRLRHIVGWTFGLACLFAGCACEIIEPPPPLEPLTTAACRESPLTACPEGTERSSQSAFRCCWPGQSWSDETDECVGRPSQCPEAHSVTENGCAEEEGDSGLLAATDGDGSRPPGVDGMVFIPGGMFWMGSEKGFSNERVVTEVHLSPYYIDHLPVTVKDYRECFDAGECPAPATKVEGKFTWKDRWISSKYCNGARDDRDNHPMDCISWFDAKTYCEWAGKRLPTEAEWEFAAKGNDCRMYPWGNDPPSSDHAVWNKVTSGDVGILEGFADHALASLISSRDRKLGTAEAGLRPAGDSPFGVADLSGNLWEWVEDWYAENLPGGRQTDPTGPEHGDQRVHRGGGWTDTDPLWLRTTDRGSHPPNYRYNRIGFRCARPVELPRS